MQWTCHPEVCCRDSQILQKKIQLQYERDNYIVIKIINHCKKINTPDFFALCSITSETKYQPCTFPSTLECHWSYLGVRFSPWYGLLYITTISSTNKTKIRTVYQVCHIQKMWIHVASPSNKTQATMSQFWSVTFWSVFCILVYRKARNFCGSIIFTDFMVQTTSTKINNFSAYT